jgi:hypothetical protein
MPQRDPGVYLEDIEYYAGTAVRFIANYSLDQYLRRPAPLWSGC